MSRVCRPAAMIVLASVAWAADPGRIVGPNPAAGLCELDADRVVWATTDDCLSSYRADIDAEKGFVFHSLPPGAYQVMGACESGNYYAFSPLKTVRVQAGETTTAYPDVRVPPNNDGPFFLALAPLSGRVLDSVCRPIEGATATMRRKSRGVEETRQNRRQMGDLASAGYFQANSLWSSNAKVIAPKRFD